MLACSFPSECWGPHQLILFRRNYSWKVKWVLSHIRLGDGAEEEHRVLKSTWLHELLYLLCLGFLCLDRLQAPHLCSTHGPSQVIAGDNIWCIIHSESLKSNRGLTPQNSDFRHVDYPHTRVLQHPQLAHTYVTTCLSVPLHCQPKNGGASSSLLNLLWPSTTCNISI